MNQYRKFDSTVLAVPSGVIRGNVVRGGYEHRVLPIGVVFRLKRTVNLVCSGFTQQFRTLRIRNHFERATNQQT